MKSSLIRVLRSDVKPLSLEILWYIVMLSRDEGVQLRIIVLFFTSHFPINISLGLYNLIENVPSEDKFKIIFEFSVW